MSDQATRRATPEEFAQFVKELEKQHKYGGAIDTTPSELAQVLGAGTAVRTPLPWLFRALGAGSMLSPRENHSNDALLAVPPVFYRGTVPGSTKRIPELFSNASGKTFVARNPASARMYGESIEKFTPSENAKILLEGTPAFGKIARIRNYDTGIDFINQIGRKRNQIDFINDVIGKAKAAGYDAISFLRDTDIGTVLLNEGVFTRSPLK